LNAAICAILRTPQRRLTPNPRRETSYVRLSLGGADEQFPQPDADGADSLARVDHLLQVDAISAYGRQRFGELRLQRDTLSAT